MGMTIRPSGQRVIEPSVAGENLASSAPAALELHIDELVLHGFTGGDRRCIGDAMQVELQRLLGQQGFAALLRGPSDLDRLDAGTFNVTPGAKPRTVGMQLARSLHRRLSSAETTRSPKTQSHTTSSRKTR